MKKTQIVSCAALSVVAALSIPAYATPFIWTGAAGDSNLVTPGNYTVGTPTVPTSAYPGQFDGDSLTFDATSTTGTTITTPATLRPFSVNFNAGSAAFSLGSATTTTTTNSGYTIRLNNSTNSQVVNFNLSGGAGSAAGFAFNTFRNDATLASGLTLTINGNNTSASAAGQRTYVSQFSSSGVKIYNGVIADSVGGVATPLLSASSDETVVGNGTGFQLGVTILTGANTYSGPTNVTGSTLLVNNTSGSGTGTSSVIVNNRRINSNTYTNTALQVPLANTTGILGGSGTIAGTIAVESGGSLRPGVTTTAGSTANLTSTSASATALVLSTGSTSIFDINGTTKGTDYDAFTTAGTITYGGALTINVNAVPGDVATAATVYDLFSGIEALGADLTSITLAGSGGLSGPLTNTAGVWTGTFGTTPVVFTEATGDLTIGTVPEPAALGLLAGVAGLLGGRRRRSIV